MKTIATDHFWTQMRMDSLKGTFELSEESAHTYLDMNTEGTLLRECQDIIEELRMMNRLFTQQELIVKDFRWKLQNMVTLDESNTLDSRLGRIPPQEVGILLSEPISMLNTPQISGVPHSTIKHADEVLEQILQREKEIEEMEHATQGIVAQVCVPNGLV